MRVHASNYDGLEDVIFPGKDVRWRLRFRFCIWWSGGGVFLPTGSAIAFDRGFGHFGRRKAT